MNTLYNTDTPQSINNLCLERPADYTVDMPKRSTKTAIFHGRISDQADALLAALHEKTGLSKTALVELAILDLAEKRGVKAEPPTVDPDKKT